MVRLALYKGKGKIGNAAIRLWTGSQYSHCELVVGEWCYSSSAMDGGVRRKAVGAGANQISLNEANWDLIDLPWADARRVAKYFRATDHHRYGWAALLTAQVFNRNVAPSGVAFCSAWCADALGIPNPLIYAPGAVGELCKYMNAFCTPGDSFALKYQQ
jgi:hypothetical protein